MKKVIIVILAVVLAAAMLTSCGGKRTDAVKAVEQMINEIGDVTLDSAEAISAAEKAYAVLSADEKKAVRNYDKLEKAAETLKALQTKFDSYDEMNEVIRQILDAATTTFSSNSTDFSDLIEKGDAIVAQYEELDADGKAYVNVTDELKEALETLKSSVDRTTASAAEYVKAFRSVYAEENYEVTAVYCIKQVRDDTEYHIFALTYKDADGNEKTVYANARCSANTTAQTIADNADSFFASKAVSEDYNAAKNGNVALDLEAVLKLVK